MLMFCRVVSVVSVRDSLSVDLSTANNFRVGTSCFGRNLGFLTPVVDVVGFLALLSESSVDFRFRLLCSRNSYLYGGAVIVVMSVSPLAVLALRNVFKSCSISVYSPHGALYICFLFRSWCRFLMVSAMFWTIRVHFGLSPTDAEANPARQQRRQYVVVRRLLIPTSNIQSDLTRASEILEWVH
jgi:hypothetical protein